MGCLPSHQNRVAALNREHQRLVEEKEIVELQHRNANLASSIGHLKISLGNKEVRNEAIESVDPRSGQIPGPGLISQSTMMGSTSVPTLTHTRITESKVLITPGPN